MSSTPAAVVLPALPPGTRTSRPTGNARYLAQLADDDGLDQEFEFGIERMLDGIGALITTAGRRR